MKKKLTCLQVYNATYRFIDIYYWRMMPAEYIVGLLSEMYFFYDKETADPATWHDWLRSVAKVPHEGEMLTKTQAFLAMLTYIEFYCDHMGSPEDLNGLVEYVHSMKNDSNHPGWNDWNKYLGQVLIEEDSREYILAMGKDNIQRVRYKMPYLHAYNAMSIFLKLYNELISSQDIKSMLHNMAYLKNEKTVDERAWKLWIESAQKIESEKNSLTYFQVFDAMILFLQTYAPHAESLQELLRYLHTIQQDENDDHWRAWLMCIDYTISTSDSCIYAE